MLACIEGTQSQPNSKYQSPQGRLSWVTEINQLEMYFHIIKTDMDTLTECISSTNWRGTLNPIIFPPAFSLTILTSQSPPSSPQHSAYPSSPPRALQAAVAALHDLDSTFMDVHGGPKLRPTAQGIAVTLDGLKTNIQLLHITKNNKPLNWDELSSICRGVYSPLSRGSRTVEPLNKGNDQIYIAKGGYYTGILNRQSVLFSEVSG